MNEMRLRREKGTTRELVSYLGVCSVIAASDEDEARRVWAQARIDEVMSGRCDVPTGTGDELRTGQALAQVVAVRTMERGREGGGVLRVGDVGVWGLN